MEEIVLAEWSTASGSVVRVMLRWFKGRLRFDVREWYRRDGALFPGRKGISMDPQRLGKLKRSIKRARALIDEDTST